MAVAHDVREGVLVDVDALAPQRIPHRRRGLRTVQAADGTPLGPVPERRVHRVQVGAQDRGARQHQQEGEHPADLLAGVQQRAADVQIERVRLVDQQEQRSLLRARTERLVQRREAVLPSRPPRDPAHGDLSRRETPPPGGGREALDQSGLGGNAGRRERKDLDAGVRGGFLPQPDEQGGLAVAARPVQHQIARRREAVPQIAEKIPAKRLLGRAARQIRRQSSRTGSKRSLPASRPHRRTRVRAATCAASAGRAGATPRPARRVVGGVVSRSRAGRSPV